MFRRMKLRIFYATPKRTPGLSTNFSRRTRNFRCHALHFLSFVGKLIFVWNTSHTGPRELNYVNLPINDKNWRAGHLKFLVRLEKLVERRGVRFCVAKIMRDYEYGDSTHDPVPKSKFFKNRIKKWPFYGHSNFGLGTVPFSRSRRKLVELNAKSVFWGFHIPSPQKTVLWGCALDKLRLLINGNQKCSRKSAFRFPVRAA